MDIIFKSKIDLFFVSQEIILNETLKIKIYYFSLNRYIIPVDSFSESNKQHFFPQI